MAKIKKHGWSGLGEIVRKKLEVKLLEVIKYASITFTTDQYDNSRQYSHYMKSQTVVTVGAPYSGNTYVKETIRQKDVYEFKAELQHLSNIGLIKEQQNHYVKFSFVNNTFYNNDKDFINWDMAYKNTLMSLEHRKGGKL